jgi:protein SCO1/2
MHARLFILMAVAPLLLRGQFPAPQADARPNVIPPSLQGVGIDQRLDEQIPLDTKFRDESGRTVELGRYFGSKPVVLALVYYECPMLCTEILNGMVGSLKGISFNAGREFEVVSVSFNPKDTPELAAMKKQNYVRRYGRAGSEDGFHFLTGDQASIDALTRAVGFRYKYDEKSGQFAHASAIYVLTPQGRLSRYFYGVEYAPRDVRLGLVEASRNKIGSPADQLLLFCYHYDPATGKYGAVAMNILRLAGAGFMLVLVASLLVLWRRDLRRDRREVLPVR